MKGGKSGMSNKLRTPCFVMEKEKLERNLSKISFLEQKTGVKILHSIKSFNEPSLLPFIASKLSGMSVSSGKEIAMAKEAEANYLHLYAPAFKIDEIEYLSNEVESISFNSLNQWMLFKGKTLQTSKGLRINPHLHLPIPEYINPNVSYSRLGIGYEEFIEALTHHKNDFSTLEGLHFHALFQSSTQGLEILFEHILSNYQKVLPQLKWINLGGGHNFSDEHYDMEHFIKMVQNFKVLYPNIQLVFEPGESVIKGCGDFICTVLDIVTVLGQEIAILDTSIETHLLDVAIVKLRLKVKGTQSFSTPYFYELSGNSCLQGDVIGEYFFNEPLMVGDKVVFEDMMGYSIVKMTEFNGIQRANFLLE